MLLALYGKHSGLYFGMWGDITSYFYSMVNVVGVSAPLTIPNGKTVYIG